jgi:hypothetical protein
MLESIKQLFLLLKGSKKMWLIPIVLLLVIVVLLVVAAQIAPVPVFIYPLI